ncbi:Fic family protein [Testudinibacter aquarius]|uniref:Fic family protein n=1 Tax=Testudinibacter aquarius TaxID=1524974 RepID=A0A4R3YBU1_9PAST|nr:Fic family protein [Testudinibacter aquarius]KAE9527531.1 cell filamentation protein Fic [Testudinibacter aquarius]TCV89456.1 Fic/DOC family protein [Testudinibacter aquarius]TNG88021.1 Fic family protein [Testudinibacter aquarius]
MADQLQRIDELKNKLPALHPLSAAELKRLQEEFIIESSYNSNAIEGNTLTLRETALILRDGITIAEKSIKEHLEVIGYKDAFNYLFELVASREPLTERIIKEIHSLVLMNDAENKGVYRRVPVRIMGADNEPAQPHLIAEQMGALVADYAEKLQQQHPIEAIAWLHLAFESIHPFIDGNGRTGRLLLNFELMKCGYLPIDIKFSDRAKYYQCFDDYYQQQQPTEFLSLVAGYEIAELERYIAILSN